jgi:dipeptidyl aminopeptidase/acylaminoacyl peptidase
MDPVYSPDGDRVAFISDRTGTRELWVADAEDSQPLQLTRLGFALGADWHPGGERIAFYSFPTGQPHGDIYVVDASGGVAHNLTEDEFEDGFPSWSANGEWLYFQSQRVTSEPYEVWRIPGDGDGPPEQITGGGVIRPQCHGGRVYFVRDRQVWSAALGGGDEKMLLDRSTYFTDWRIWDNKLIYVRRTESSEKIIEVLALATGETREHARIELAPGTVNWAGFTVSPDGRHILFSRLDVAGSDLWMIENYR